MSKSYDIPINEKIIEGLKSLNQPEANSAKKIGKNELKNMHDYVGREPIEIDLVYSMEKHSENHFGQLYRPEAKLFLHNDLAEIVVL